MFYVGLSFTVTRRRPFDWENSWTQEDDEEGKGTEGLEAAAGVWRGKKNKKSGTEGFSQGKRCFRLRRRRGMRFISHMYMMYGEICFLHDPSTSEEQCAPAVLLPGYQLQIFISSVWSGTPTGYMLFSLIIVGETGALNPELLNPGLLAVRRQR